MAMASRGRTAQTSKQREADEFVQEVKKFLLGFVRGFGKGVALYCGFKAISALTKKTFSHGLSVIPGQVFSWDCARFATFLGLYPSVYQLLVKQLKKYRNKNDGWNYGLAGGLSGLSVIVEDKGRRQLVSLFAFARAVGAGMATLVYRGHLPKVPYIETIAFCFCCGFVVYCTVLKPEVLQKGYYKSILKWSRDYSDEKLDLSCRLPNDHHVTCEEAGLHSGSCTAHAAKEFFLCIPPFARLYIPIYVIPVLIFKRKMLLERPKRVLLSIVKKVIVSAAFLSSVTVLSRLTLCHLRNFRAKPPPVPAIFPAISGVVCGISLLFEKENRRQELSLFLIPHVLYALNNMDRQSLPNKRIFNRVPFGTVVMFCLSMMVLMHAYERQPHALTPLVNGLLKFFVGKRNSETEEHTANSSPNHVMPKTVY